MLFRRTDLPGKPTTLARADRVTGTARRTTLGSIEQGVTLVEHVLASLAGLRVDNCLIEIDAAEPPGLDGSALGFVQAILDAGIVLQPARRGIWAPTEPVVVSHGSATIGWHPPDATTGMTLRASYLLDYGATAPIPRQAYTTPVTPETFARDLSGCRTFLLDTEVGALQQQGIGLHLSPADVLVFGTKGPIDNTLRHADEPARHKLLDMIGDLALCGVDLVGHVVAYRSGHALNVALANAILNRMMGTQPIPDVVVPTRVSFPRRRQAA